ncbi:MAG TPA: energy transducer TonB [Rhodopila sp.]
MVLLSKPGRSSYMEPRKRLTTMGRSTISPPGFEAERPQAASTTSPRRRFLLIAVALSVGIHVLAALLIIYLPRALPPDAEPKQPATITLLMVEKKGAGPVTAAAPAVRQPTPHKQAEPPKTEPPKPEPPKSEPPKPEPPKKEPPPKPVPPAPTPLPAPPLPSRDSETVPKPAEPPPPQPAKQDPNPTPKPAEQPPPQPAKQEPTAPPKPVEARLVPPRPQQVPVFNLAGTESDSNAIAIGQGILPAMPDDRFRNRPPIYPIEAQLHGQHGSVTLLIHVGENGVATGVDVQHSSGVDMLDQAAIAAVRNWRFRPALQDGHPVPFDYPFEFIFEAH